MLWRPRADAGEATGLPGKNSKRIVSLGHLVLQQPNAGTQLRDHGAASDNAKCVGDRTVLRRRRCTSSARWRCGRMEWRRAKRTIASGQQGFADVPLTLASGTDKIDLLAVTIDGKPELKTSYTLVVQ